MMAVNKHFSISSLISVELLKHMGQLCFPAKPAMALVPVFTLLVPMLNKCLIGEENTNFILVHSLLEIINPSQIIFSNYMTS